MVYGMAAQWLVYYIRFDTDHTVPKRIFRALGFSMALLFPTTIQQDVSYIAHGAGFIAGLSVAAAMIPLVHVKTTEQ